jgi:hypothetical protein
MGSTAMTANGYAPEHDDSYDFAEQEYYCPSCCTYYTDTRHDITPTNKHFTTEKVCEDCKNNSDFNN